MSIEQAVEILRELVTVSLSVSSPILMVAVSIGVAVSLAQAVTSIQEASLSFIPKVTAIGVAMVVSGPWILKMLIQFTTECINRMPEMAR
jgi:flagellar biosynthetic protein FliQ